MKIACVHIHVKETHLEAFKEASLKNHEGSIQEPGNIRFDVLQDANDPCKFMLYEVFEDEAAQKFHKTTAHYLEWRETVKDMMAEPRQGFPYTLLAPLNEDQW